MEYARLTLGPLNIFRAKLRSSALSLPRVSSLGPDSGGYPETACWILSALVIRAAASHSEINLGWG